MTFIISFIFLSAFKMGDILQIVPHCENRLHYIQSLLSHTEENHLILIPKSNNVVSRKYQNWASSYETMILSMLESDEVRSVLIIENNEKNSWRTDMPNIIQGSFTNYERQLLKSKIFILPETPFKYHLFSPY